MDDFVVKYLEMYASPTLNAPPGAPYFSPRDRVLWAITALSSWGTYYGRSWVALAALGVGADDCTELLEKFEFAAALMDD